ncbi:glycosyltransferase [Candidatus Saccharibacteria bacterium]|nr:glycosyltransferase [Candidatus Saccharibacteria bacterium]
MTTKPKVSIIVPIYKVEKYLRECVDSILAQNLKEIEVILVDDGSPDRCGEIVDEYAEADSRVVPVHQKNSGYSVAVNRGIDMAKGEYIGIIESDDWIEPDMYEQLYKSAKENDADVTKGAFYYYNPTLKGDRQNIVYTNPSGIDLRYAPNRPFKLIEWPKIIGFHASIWSAIYKASFIKKIKIPETAGASYQDFPFMCEFLTKAERITVVKKPFVHWRNEPSQGNSTSAGGEKLLLMAQNTLTGLDVVKESGQYRYVKEAFYAHALWANIGFFFKIDRKYKKEYYERLKKIFRNLKYDPEFKYTYFTTYERIWMRCILEKNNWHWMTFYRIRNGIKNRIQRYLGHLFPTYRIAEYNKWRLYEMSLQNSVFQDELTTIEYKIDQLIKAQKASEKSKK